MERILIVDDDPLVCKLVSAGLKEEGYTVKAVNHGKAALDSLKLFQFNLIVLDIVMPEMDGFQLLRAIRSQGETAFLPVIFLTAQTNEKDRVQGFRLGADDYLPKPFNIEELVLRIKRVLQRAKAKSSKGLVSASLQGSLEDIGLGPLLTLLEMEEKSGLLRLSNKTNKTIFYIRDGNVIRTRSNSGGKKGAESVYEALRWTSGTFQFKTANVDGAVEIEQSTIQLLMEASRRVDEKMPGA